MFDRALGIAKGQDAAEFLDPIGTPVVVTRAFVDYMLERPELQAGRERYFPLNRELIEDPHEIWVKIAQSELTGRASRLRHRYLNARVAS